MKNLSEFLQFNAPDGTFLLENCFSTVHLTNGVSFSMDALDCHTEKTDSRTTVTSGGTDILPQLRLSSTFHGTHWEVQLELTNTTPEPLRLKTLDILTCKNGYLNTPVSSLSLRQTGWQTFSPASLKTPFNQRDQWVQPPLYTSVLSPISDDEWLLHWMTIVHAPNSAPLLIGFGSAHDYLGTIQVRPSADGHRLTASNHLEGISLQPNATVCSEPLIIAVSDNETKLLQEYGRIVASNMNARVPSTTPTGWSHWLYYFANVTEGDILENLHQLDEKKLDLEYVQIDDGYQTAFGDWLSINERFPNGMKFLADEIKKTGRKPGLWLSPFMADARSDVAQEHPEWFLKDDRGALINVNRHGDTYWKAPNYGLDLTHPQAYEWLEHVIRTICETWGYEYLKVDFLYAGAITAARHDPSYTSVQAYRRGLELIRRIAGERIVLGCGAPLLCSVGLVDDMRIGPDLSWELDGKVIQPQTDATKPVSRNPTLSLLSHMWMNKTLWVNDTDYIRTRQHDISLDWNQTVALTTLIALSGGALYNSDRLRTLEADGLKLLKRLLPAANVVARPVDFHNTVPSVLRADVTLGEFKSHLVAYFNHSTKITDYSIDLSSLELKTEPYHLFDLLSRSYLGVTTDQPANLKVPALGACLVAVSPMNTVPHVVSSDGHLLGAAGDIISAAWKDDTLTIETSNVNCALIICAPAPYTLKNISQHTTAVPITETVFKVTSKGMHISIVFSS